MNTDQGHDLGRGRGTDLEERVLVSCSQTDTPVNVTAMASLDKVRGALDNSLVDSSKPASPAERVTETCLAMPDDTAALASGGTVAGPAVEQQPSRCAPLAATGPKTEAQAAIRVTLVNRESLRPEGNGPGQGGPPVRTEVANRVKMLLFKHLQGSTGPADRNQASARAKPISDERQGCLCRRNSVVHHAAKSTTTLHAPGRDASNSVSSAAHESIASEASRPWNEPLETRVWLCIGHLRAHRGRETLGILGASGSVEAVERLRRQVTHDDRLPSDADPHAVAGLLKETLRTTRPALLSTKAYGSFLEMARTSGPGASWDEAINIFRLWQRIRSDQLYAQCNDLLVELLLLLHEISQLTTINKMTSRNLALVMAPCLCEWDPLRPNALEQLHVMTDMVQYLIERATLIADMEGHRSSPLGRATLSSRGPRSCHAGAEPPTVPSSEPPCCA
ncbi:hypothetical protein F1559_004140 [Cyanidiococcus yangmingshanensis]|uniref:Rho-GAP domain-containing protein n=1 Tax=Cyanidiococcus yangmingshanensis TaxID=2690220 RepID=A0A7J7II88_9RHOD|nr:hypothetical protein F1559_004140 [Cyanidiococcus yangmingshanensis]